MKVKSESEVAQSCLTLRDPMGIYTLPCVKYKASGKVPYNRELSLVLCDDLKRWGGGGWSRKEAQERGDICILTADSHCCTAETNITL